LEDHGETQNQVQARRPLSGSMQLVNAAIWNEWLSPHHGYEPAENIDIELYNDMPIGDPHYQSEIWLPIKRE
jgi:AraC family transcriptional regulator